MGKPWVIVGCVALAITLALVGGFVWVNADATTQKANQVNSLAIGMEQDAGLIPKTHLAKADHVLSFASLPIAGVCALFGMMTYAGTSSAEWRGVVGTRP